MEVWLFYVILGLVMDIIGIWILAKPLLRIVYKDESVWQKQYAKILHDFKIAKQEHETKRYRLPENIPDDNFEFKQFQAFVFDVFNNMNLEKQHQRLLAFVGLFVISFGFLFQILGNIIKP